MPPEAPLARGSLHGVVAPFGQSVTLPGEAYTSPEVFSWEQEVFFEESWVCVGRTPKQAGEQRAVEVGRDGVVLVRDHGGTVRAFFNVCRHRGHELLHPSSTTRADVVRCPYHAWVYGLDGRLRGAPGFGAAAGPEGATRSLVAARMAEWHGWAFVNAAGEAPAFEDHVGSLDEHISAYEPERLVVAARSDYVVAANWKLIVENYHECYHCSNIHPELCRVSPPASGYNFEPDGAWIGGSMELLPEAETMSMTGRSGAAVLPAVQGGRRRKVYYFGIFPNVLIGLHPDYVLTHRLEPLAVDRTRVECEWLFGPEALEEDGFDPGYAVEFWDVTNLQDWEACESVQRGVASRGHRQGPLGPREDAVYSFVTMVARGYLGERPHLR